MHKNMTIRGLSVLFLLIGLTYSISPGQEQSSPDTDPEAKQHLTESAVNSFGASSYKMTIEQTFDQEFQNMNRSNTQSQTIHATFEKPYFHGTTNVSSKLSNQREMSYIGKLNTEEKSINMFLKSSLTNNEWKNLDSTSPLNIDSMLQRFLDPKNLVDRLKQIRFGGEETINGTNCVKITASQKEDVLKKTVDDLLKGAMKQLSNMELDIKESNVTYWIGTSTNFIEKIQVDTKQTIQISMSMGKKDRTMSIDQDVKMTTRFTDYGSAKIDQELKQTYENLSENGGEKKESEDSSSEGETF